MPKKLRRDCPICYKPGLLYLSDHLRQVHHLTSEEREPWIKATVFSYQVTPYMRPNIVLSWVPQGLSYTIPHILPHGIPPQPPSIKLQQQPPLKAKTQASHCLETKAYSEFQFNHMFSMLVVGPPSVEKRILWNNCEQHRVYVTPVKNQDISLGTIFSGRDVMSSYSRVLETTLPLCKVCLS